MLFRSSAVQRNEFELNWSHTPKAAPAALVPPATRLPCRQPTGGRIDRNNNDNKNCPVPSLAGTSVPRLHHAEKPRADGQHAHRTRRRRKHFPAMAAISPNARGGVGLMVTGGFAPNIAGWTKPFSGMLASSGAARRHQPVTDAVHAEGGKIALQILHTGRYGYHPLCVSPSRIQSPISPFTPFEISAGGIERQIRAFIRCAQLARDAGYDGVEIRAAKAISSTSFWSRTPTSAPTTGAAAMPTACDWPSRSCAEPAKPWAKISSSSTGCRSLI